MQCLQGDLLRVNLTRLAQRFCNVTTALHGTKKNLRMGVPNCPVPSDTKLLLTKNYSEIFDFEKITNFIRNSLKKSFFPADIEQAKPLENYENK